MYVCVCVCVCACVCVCERERKRERERERERWRCINMCVLVLAYATRQARASTSHHCMHAWFSERRYACRRCLELYMQCIYCVPRAAVCSGHPTHVGQPSGLAGVVVAGGSVDQGPLVSHSVLVDGSTVEVTATSFCARTGTIAANRAAQATVHSQSPVTPRTGIVQNGLSQDTHCVCARSLYIHVGGVVCTCVHSYRILLN